MEIEIYLADQIGMPDAEIIDPSFRLAWKGTAADLEIYRLSDDEKILEIVFEAVSSYRRPKTYDDELRSLSIGDVVVIDYRAYRYLPAGWKRLDKFDLS